MQHQDFTLPQNLDRTGLLQILTPKDEEGPAAAAFVKEILRPSRLAASGACRRLSLALVH
jgi:hypothetical protein